MNTVADFKKAKDGNYFNPMEPLHKQGIGSLAWQDSWNLFDQTIVNKAFFPTDFKTFQFHLFLLLLLCIAILMMEYPLCLQKLFSIHRLELYYK